jgi:hypothetical protein
MKSRTSVLRRVTVCVAASALVSALIGFGSPVSNATTQSTPAWRQAIAALAVPGQGCFTASFPAIQWLPTPCSSVHPKGPQQVAPGPGQEKAGGGSQQVGGDCNTCDYAARTAAPMTRADGSFPSVTCAASPCERNTGASGQDNVYSLQLNTQIGLPATQSCSTSSTGACKGWQQFVYDSHVGTDGTGQPFGTIRVEPALINYGQPGGPCPARFNSSDGAGNCYDTHENATQLKQLTPQQLMSDPVIFSGQAGLVNGTLTDTVKLIDSDTAYAATAPDKLVNLSGHWYDAQFGIYGECCGEEADFIPGTDLKVNVMTHSGTTAAPQCEAFRGTAESNNLYLQPAPTLGTGTGTGTAPTIESDQSRNPPTSPAACANGNGWGEIHLNTFGCASCSTHLSYNFQASGDFQLAAAPLPSGGPPFNVQARLIPYAANPNLSVSQDIAAQIGPSQVAVCNAPPRLEINKHAVQLTNGHRIGLPGGGSVSRQANVYLIRDRHGDSVQAAPKSPHGVPYLDTWVGLGRWPTTVSGLLANAGNHANAVESSGGTVLTAPFSFGKFYKQYGNSWRVTPAQDLLSACGTKFASGNPTQNYEASSLPHQEYLSAHAICVSAGVRAPALLDACILDVAVLGKEAVNVYRTLPTNVIWGKITG